MSAFPSPESLTGINFEGRRGLLGASVAVLAILASATAVLGIPLPWNVVVVAAGQAAVLAAWLANRRLPHFKKNEIGMLVSVRHNGNGDAAAKSEQILVGLLNQLRSEAATALPDRGGVRFRIRRLPNHIEIGGTEDGTRILERSRATYVTWANAATAGRARGESVLDLGQIRYCLRHATLEEQQNRSFTEALDDVHGLPAPYRVRFDNDVEDLKSVADRLALAAKYHIGLALAAGGWRDQAISLLEQCVGDRTLRLHHRARREVAALRASYWMGPRWPTARTDRPTLEAARDDAIAALAMDHDCSFAYQVRANAEFLLGNLPEASRANDLHKRFSEVSFHVNRAVFDLDRGRFDEALAHYQRAKRLHFGRTPSEIEGLRRTAVNWLCDAVEVRGNNFNFGLAFMSDYLGDTQLALEAYSEVLPSLDGFSTVTAFVTERVRILRAEVAQPEHRGDPVHVQARSAAPRRRRKRRPQR